MLLGPVAGLSDSMKNCREMRGGERGKSFGLLEEDQSQKFGDSMEAERTRRELESLTIL